MNIGYIEWHDGLGYDLEALDRLDARDREEAEKILIPRAEKDWRDLEALDRLSTSAANAAILRARNAKNPEIRLHAHGYGPPASEPPWESAINYALGNMKSYTDGLVLAFNAAVAHPTPAVIDGLWKFIRQGGREGTYHAGEALAKIAGLPEDESLRQLFLRLQGPNTPQRMAAIAELERVVSRT